MLHCRRCHSKPVYGKPQIEHAFGSLAFAGLVVGFLSGFFGIGGDFLIVPAIMLGRGMTAINAIGSSLVSVGALGATTAATYALAGLVNGRVDAILSGNGMLQISLPSCFTLIVVESRVKTSQHCIGIVAARVACCI